MWYLITAGAGLSLGLALLIWGLRERSARHAAEARTVKEQIRANAARRMADKNGAAADRLEQRIKRMKQQIALLHGELQATRRRLANMGDPEAVKAWLDDELKGGPV